ncbi:MAG: sensor histidine kinase, partial [Bacteroidota bacterium]
KVIGIYIIVFFFVNLYYKDEMQAYATICALPFTLVSFYLFKIDKFYFSKLLNYIQISLIITALCLITGMDSLVFMYFFPLIIGGLVMFQGSEKITGYILVFSTILVLIVLSILDLHLDSNHRDYAHLQSDKIANTVGVGIFCLIELIYFIRYTTETHNKLIDKTELLEIKNNQLLSALYTRDKMMSVISHDLRSPIIALNSAMNVFTEQEIDPVLQKDIISQIKIKSNKLLLLIEELIKWAKSQSTAINVNIERLDVNTITSYVKEQVEVVGQSKGIEIEFINTANGVFLLGDKNMLDAIFRNLISNAIKFSTNGSKVQLSISRLENNCELSIRDFGKGMTEKEISDFKRGISFSTSGISNEKGHGLGLQLVKEFLHKQNSELNIESYPGFGSRFYFYLPNAD